MCGLCQGNTARCFITTDSVLIPAELTTSLACPLRAEPRAAVSFLQVPRNYVGGGISRLGAGIPKGLPHPRACRSKRGVKGDVPWQGVILGSKGLPVVSELSGGWIWVSHGCTKTVYDFHHLPLPLHVLFIFIYLFIAYWLPVLLVTCWVRAAGLFLQEQCSCRNPPCCLHKKSHSHLEARDKQGIHGGASSSHSCQRPWRASFHLTFFFLSFSSLFRPSPCHPHPQS